MWIADHTPGRFPLYFPSPPLLSLVGGDDANGLNLSGGEAASLRVLTLVATRCPARPSRRRQRLLFAGRTRLESVDLAEVYAQHILAIAHNGMLRGGSSGRRGAGSARSSRSTQRRRQQFSMILLERLWSSCGVGPGRMRSLVNLR